MDALPDRSGPWVTQHLSFPECPDDVYTIRYRDPVEAIKTLWKDPVNSPEMVFSPHKLYRDSKKEARIYSEMWTGKWWNTVQVRYRYTLWYLDADSTYHFIDSPCFQQSLPWPQSLSQQTKPS